MKKLINYIKPTSLAQRKVFGGEIAIGEIKVLKYSLRDSEEKRQVEVKMELTADDESLEGKTFNYFSQAIHNGVLTLWANKRREFTALDVARILVGDSHKRFEKDSKTLKRIEEELNRMSAVNLYMDLRDEQVVQNRSFFDEDGEVSDLDAPILPLERTPVRMANGYPCEGYRITRTPPFYVYASSTNQIDNIRLQHNQMEIYRKPVRFAIREYLYERILLMKVKSGSGSHFNRVDIDNIREVVKGIHESCPTRQEISVVKNQTKILLASFVNTGLLLDWHIEGNPDDEEDFCYVLELNLEGVAERNVRVNMGKGD